MDYDCHLIPTDKLLTNPVGIQEPLCNDCVCPDCTNPIREHTVSVVGINKTMRLWTVGSQMRIVVACKGYVGDQDVQTGSGDKPAQT